MSMEPDRQAPQPAAPEAPAVPDHLLLYDGVCGLCDRLVQWILAHERDQTLRFAPLQGETTARLRARHPTIPTEVSTVVYLAGGTVHLRSKAILHSARHLRRPWRWAFHLRWVPAIIADLVYRLVARVRYRLWGKLDACRIPDPASRHRFLP